MPVVLEDSKSSSTVYLYRPRLSGQDAARPILNKAHDTIFNKVGTFFIVFSTLHWCVLKVFVVSPKSLLRHHAGWHCALPGFQHKILMNLHGNDYSQGTQKPFFVLPAVL